MIMIKHQTNNAHNLLIITLLAAASCKIFRDYSDAGCDTM